MGSRALPALASVLLLAALATTIWLYTSPSPSATRTGVQPTVAGGSTDETRTPSDLARPERASRDEGADAAPGLRQVVETTTEPATATAGAAPPVRLLVRGRVVDRNGAPVADARVYASNQTAWPVDWDEDGAMPWQVRSTARTDASGRYELEGLSPGPARLVVRKAGYAPYDRSDLSLPAGQVIELDPTVLGLGATLSGRVVTHDGQPVAGAELLGLGDEAGFFFGGRQQRPLATSAADGTFRIDEMACGAWRLLARHEEHPSRVVEGLAERPGEEVSGIRIELERGEVVSGRVEGIPDAERGELSVRALPATDAMDPEAFLGSRTGAIGSNGQFEVVGLRAGNAYDLQLRRETGGVGFPLGGSRSRRTRVTAGDRGVVIHYTPAASLSFQVLDARTGLPVEEFVVSAGIDWARPLLDENRKPLEKHPDGRVVVDDLRPTSDDDRVRLEVRATGYETWKRDDLVVRVGETYDIGVVHLEPKPVLRVTVVDRETGKPLPGARVALEEMPDPVEPGSRSFRMSVDVDAGDVRSALGGGGGRATTDENGVAVLTSLEGERTRITANMEGYAPGQLDDVYLPPGEVVDETIELIRGGTVVVTCLDADEVPLAGARVEHQDPNALASGVQTMFFGAGGRQQVTDTEGRLTFSNLAPGVHAFRLGEGNGPAPFLVDGGQAAVQFAGPGPQPGEEWVEVEVADGATRELLLRARPVGELVGRVFEAGKPLPGATLRLKEAGADAAPTPRMMIPGMGGGPEARSGGDGEYTFSGVKAGRYELSVEHPTRRMPASLEVAVDPGRNRLDVDLPVSVVRGRIVDPEGKPLSGLRVTAERKRSGGQRQTMARFIMVSDGGDTMMSGGPELGDATYTDAKGEYELRGVTPDVELVVKAEGELVQPGSSDAFEVRANEIRENVDFALEAGGRIEVEALTPDGTPARFCIVRASYTGEGAGEVAPKTGFVRSGTTTLEGLRPGPWTVSVQRAGFAADDQAPPLEKVVEVVALETARESFVVD